MTLLTYDPTGSVGETVSKLAPRLTTLQHATVGILHNHKQNARETGLAVAGLLQEQFEIKEVVGPEQVRGGVWIAEKQQIDELAEQCDLVIVTLGD